jgi:hypothetical protein
MSTGQSSIALQIQAGIGAAVWFEPLLGLVTGALGGRLADVLATTMHHEGTWIGTLFGLAFGRCFASRSTSPGAGLIWGVSCAFLLWVIFPAGMILCSCIPQRCCAMPASAFPNLSPIWYALDCL